MSGAVLVIATGNAHKIGELRSLLPGLPLVGLDAFPPLAAPDEDAPDYAGNAIIKARAAFEHTGAPSLADDSGLEVDGLDGAPGIHSARYAPGSDADRRRALLAALEARGPGASRRARFVCVIAVAGLPPAELERARQAGLDVVAGCAISRGTCAGRIIDHERGGGGFGYDPLFEVPALGRTFAELSADEKHALSHRGRAAARLHGLLTALFHAPPDEKNGTPP
ncbi:non-canonical purine NTP pyrophosphatase [Myxococcota bacterium]|nr:non-canonical purine NTP pyrophosphatase [Myxococcota bacterium]